LAGDNRFIPNNAYGNAFLGEFGDFAFGKAGKTVQKKKIT
jgi:hypothetical protein